MKHRLFHIPGGVILSMLATACASNPADPVPLEEKLAQRGYVIGQGVNRITDYQVSGWNSIDREHVIMNFGASRNYLISLRTPCDGLRSASVISFSTTIGNLTDKDKLLVRDDGHHLLHCWISTINELEKINRPGNEK